MAIMKSPELFDLLEQHGPRLVEDKFAPSFEWDSVPGRVLQLSIETMLEELAPNLWEHSLDRLVDFGHAVGQVPVWSPVMTYELFSEAVANRVKNSMGQRFPLPAGIGKGRIINGISDEDLKRAFLLWQDLCEPQARMGKRV